MPPTLEPALVPATPQEPNDDRATAQPLPLGVPTAGYISDGAEPSEGDQDWFVLTIPGDTPSILSVNLEGPSDLDVVLEWMAATPRGKRDRALIQADVVRKRPGDELLGNLRVSPGLVYLRVRSAWYRNAPRKGSQEAYSLTADIHPWADTIEAEPNDVEADAVTGTFDRPARGTLGHVGDRDVWRIPVSAPAGTRLQLILSRITDVKVETSVHWQSQGGTVIRTKARKGDGVTLRNVAVPERADPVLVVTLHAVAGAAPRSAYDLLLTPEVPSEHALEAEPNDIARLATPLSLGVQFSGYLDRKDDMDYVAIAVIDATTVRATLTPSKNTRATLDVIRPDGTTALTRKGEAAGASVSVLGLGLTPGRWLTRVQGAPHDALQPYTLKVEATTTQSSEREPNNIGTSTTLKPLLSKTPSTGWIHPAGDLDFWALERPEERGAGIVTFQVDPPPGLRLDVTLHTLEGLEVTGRRGLTAGQPGTFTHFLAPGRYTVRVSGSTVSGYADSPYTLRLLD
jgi:hypothetical protein